MKETAPTVRGPHFVILSRCLSDSDQLYHKIIHHPSTHTHNSESSAPTMAPTAAMLMLSLHTRVATQASSHSPSTKSTPALLSYISALLRQHPKDEASTPTLPSSPPPEQGTTATYRWTTDRGAKPKCVHGDFDVWISVFFFSFFLVHICLFFFFKIMYFKFSGNQSLPIDIILFVSAKDIHTHIHAQANWERLRKNFSFKKTCSWGIHYISSSFSAAMTLCFNLRKINTGELPATENRQQHKRSMATALVRQEIVHQQKWIVWQV